MAATAAPIAVSARRPTCYSWVLYNDSLGEDAGAFATGGDTLLMLAAGALNIGDAVYFATPSPQTNKTNSAGNQQLRCGIIVGGVPRSVESATLEVNQRFTDVGKAAAIANDPVLVCVAGLCYGVSDGAIAYGTPVKLSTGTAGRLVAATSGTDAGKVLGTAFDAAAGAGEVIRILVGVS